MLAGEALRMAAESLWTHKLRSFLTVLGVVIGVMAVLSVVTIGKSFEQSIVAGFSTVDDRTIFVTCQMHGAIEGAPPGCSGLGRVFTERDRQEILALPGVAAVNRQGELPIAGLVFQNRSIPFGTLSTTESDSTAVSSLAGGFAAGRVYRPGEPEVVASHDVAALLGNGTAIQPGARLTLRFLDQTEEEVTIVGVLNRETNAFVSFTAATIYAPIDRFYRFPAIPSPVTGEPTSTYEGFSVIADDPQGVDETRAAVEAYLASPRSDAHHLMVDGTEPYVATGSTIVEQIGGIFDNITLLISAIAVVSLVVGAIGIANIMLVSVTERTREIGVLKALGAKDSEVLRVFLLEAALVGFVGAVFGVALGLVTGALVIEYVFTDFTLVFPLDWVLLSLAVGVLTGVLAGLLPARRATRVQPVQALAHE